ncbi:MAG: sigma 54-interacting transcriptional regulator [Angelakisella sp.]|nr:sigma 54-interacting transcriptional regulator [Angelakisella sp.]
MIKIVMIAPYEALLPVMHEVVENYIAPEPIQVTIHMLTSYQLDGCILNGDVAICRGYTMEVMKEKYPHIPAIPLVTSGYDVIWAAKTAITRFSAKKLAFVGAYEMVHGAENINGILGVEVRTYCATFSDDIPAVVAQAKADGCDCIIGGMTVLDVCGPTDNKLVITSDKTAITNSLDEAIRTVQLIREQQRRTLRQRTLLDYSQDGVVSVEHGKVVSCNKVARRYLDLKEAVLPLSVEKVLPFAKLQVSQVLESGVPLENEVYHIGQRTVTVDCIPLDQDSAGLVLFLRNVERIRRDEALIRKKIQAKGQQAKYKFEDIVYRSPEFAKTITTARTYAAVDSPVLIVGESGTGKELIAQSIHNASERRDGPFIAINCAALPENLLESELFGYTDGAFTGAMKGGKEGLFEAAHGGTMFLDEISEVPILFQSKLLRVLQENEVRRIGSQQVTTIDVRIIAATNRNLRHQVEKGLFRQDLLYRLNVLYLYIPPLRCRPGDIEDLFYLYLKEFSQKYNKSISMITAEATKLLTEYPWAGNVRELKNIAERICVLTTRATITADVVRNILYEDTMDFEEIALKLPQYRQTAGTKPTELPEIKELDEKEQIIRLLQQNNGSKLRVAQLMKIDRTTLWRKMKRYEIGE